MTVSNTDPMLKVNDVDLISFGKVERNTEGVEN